MEIIKFYENLFKKDQKESVYEESYEISLQKTYSKCIFFENKSVGCKNMTIKNTYKIKKIKVK